MPPIRPEKSTKPPPTRPPKLKKTPPPKVKAVTQRPKVKANSTVKTIFVTSKANSTKAANSSTEVYLVRTSPEDPEPLDNSTLSTRERPSTGIPFSEEADSEDHAIDHSGESAPKESSVNDLDSDDGVEETITSPKPPISQAGLLNDGNNKAWNSSVNQLNSTVVPPTPRSSFNFSITNKSNNLNPSNYSRKSHCPRIASFEKRFDRIDLYLNSSTNVGIVVSSRLTNSKPNLSDFGSFTYRI